MIRLRTVVRRILCFTRVDIDNTYELPNRPKQGSQHGHTPKHGTQPLDVEKSQPHLHSTDGTEANDTSMPLKRKNSEVAVDMDRPDRKTKTTKKNKKIPAAEEGMFFPYIRNPFERAWWSGQDIERLVLSLRP
jgi:hypothetical protein